LALQWDKQKHKPAPPRAKHFATNSSGSLRRLVHIFKPRLTHGWIQTPFLVPRFIEQLTETGQGCIASEQGVGLFDKSVNIHKVAADLVKIVDFSALYVTGTSADTREK
jgi:hypothetical protein